MGLIDVFAAIVRGLMTRPSRRPVSGWYEEEHSPKGTGRTKSLEAYRTHEREREKEIAKAWKGSGKKRPGSVRRKRKGG